MKEVYEVVASMKHFTGKEKTMNFGEWHTWRYTYPHMAPEDFKKMYRAQIREQLPLLPE